MKEAEIKRLTEASRRLEAELVEAKQDDQRLAQTACVDQ